MGEEQKVGYEELLATSRAAFEASTDFTLAVEEEFALLDPATLELVNRFEELQQAAQGTELEPHLVGELIASEVEVRTGRCETFAEAAEKLGERRAQLRALADGVGVGLSAAGDASVEPLAGPAHHRHAALPPQRRAAALRRLAQQHVRPARARRHQRRGPRDQGHERAAELSARAARAVGELAVRRGRVHAPALGAHADLHAHVPALRHPGRAGRGWDEWESYVRFLYETGSVTEHTQMWWSVRPHLAFPTVEIRICDAQPDLAEARSLAALSYSLTARIARALDEGEPLPSWPHRLLEENLWRALRWGLSGELIDFERGESIPARARLEQLLEWVQPVAEELGAAQWLAIPERNAAERQIARHEEGRVDGGDLRRAGARARRWKADLRRASSEEPVSDGLRLGSRPNLQLA